MAILRKSVRVPGNPRTVGIGVQDVEQYGTYNPLNQPPSGILPQTPPIREYIAYPQRRGYKRREYRVMNDPDGVSAYLFPHAYDPMVVYPGTRRNVRIIRIEKVCKEVWEY